MRSLFLAVLGLLVLSLSDAKAQERPVVVELFTSQGCSSCPPADAYLHELAARDGVIALALHVDYWDYIGWTDVFGSPAWSDRQRDYARAGGRSMVYTPQMIINGSDHVVGNRPKDVEELLRRHGAHPVVIDIAAERQGDRVTIAARARQALSGQFEVQLVRYLPKETVKIEHGENAGRTLEYVRVVTGIALLQTWNGRGALAVETAMEGREMGAVLIQRKGSREIVAAAQVK